MNAQTFLILSMLVITAGIPAWLITRAVGMKLGTWHKTRSEDTSFLATAISVTLFFSIFYGLVWAARYVKWL